MDMKINKKTIIVIILILVVALGGIFLLNNSQKKEKINQEQEQVKNIIIEFGKAMRSVPLAASEDIIIKAIENNYSDFISPDLLASWVNNPLSAPGRLTSSPWPDRIEIFSLSKNQDGSYVAQSNVIEMTSRELVVGGVADMYGVTIIIQKQDGKWLITQFKKL